MKSYFRDPVLLIFFGIAALTVLGAMALGWQNHRVASWPRVPVQVISSEVARNKYDTYEGQVKVRLADGAEKLLVTSWASSNPAAIQAELVGLQVGASVGVPQDPENTNDMRLPPDPSQAWVPWVLAAGGLLFALIPIGVIALSERKDAVRIGGLVFVACGLLFAGVGGWLAWSKIDVLRNWPEAEATVMEARVGYRPGKRRALQGIDLVMTYQAGGQEIRSVVGSRAGTSDTAWVENQIATTYAPGTKHRIRFRETFPTDATFEAEWSIGYFWEAVLAAGLGLMTAGLGAAIAKFLK